MSIRISPAPPAAVWLLTSAMTVLALALPAASHAQSELSEVSLLPIASVVIAGSELAEVSLTVLEGGGTLLVRSIEASAQGSVVVLERASDAAVVSIEFARDVAAGLSLATGTAVVVTTIGAGLLLSVAGEAIALIPNALGEALLHNERVTR
jgi:hypothetical protein